MRYSLLPVLSLVLAVSFFSARANAQFELVIQADETLGYRYNPAEDGINPALTISTTATPPASLDYGGVTSGTFTMRFVAPEGMRFTIDPQGHALRLFFQVAYSGDVPGGLTALEGRSLSFADAVGTTPQIFTDYSTLTDIVDLDVAYLSVNFSMSVAGAFSFTELVYTREFIGTGEDVSLFANEQNYFLNIQAEDYFGEEPPLHTPFLTLAPIPEPSAYAMLVGAGVLVFVLGGRRRRTRARS